MMREKIEITTDFIKLDSFLKLAGIVGTGGMAKNMILEGLVSVDGTVCKMRGKKLYPGAIVVWEEQEYEVAACR